ncbi:hypothetical protein A6P54_20880 [Bacillus sp. MKU004]|nr:hypothetical protein A6P54_20880 [Bacillus sp. MKU004]
MLKMIIERYKEAGRILDENTTNKIPALKGLKRAYLEAYSDYQNPVIEEVNLLEKMVRVNSTI